MSTRIKEIDIELTLTIRYEVYPADPSVGLVDKQIENIQVIGNDGKEAAELIQLVGLTQLENIEEQLLEDEA